MTKLKAECASSRPRLSWIVGLEMMSCGRSREWKQVTCCRPLACAWSSDGKIYLFCGFDELHGYKTWDILEAMQGDPTRTDVMIWITSYASLYHKPDVRLFDLFAQGKRLSPR